MKLRVFALALFLPLNGLHAAEPARPNIIKTPIRPATVLHGGNGIFAIRSGPWKLVKSDGSAKNATVKGRHDELYNLAADPAEAKDLAAEQPERVKAMNALLEKLITEGRFTPGAPQKNDVEVRRYPTSDGAKEKNSPE